MGQKQFCKLQMEMEMEIAISLMIETDLQQPSRSGCSMMCHEELIEIIIIIIILRVSSCMMRILNCS